MDSINRARTEIATARRIVEAMQEDFRYMDAAFAPSKRGSRFQRAFDSLQKRITVAMTCLQDAENILEPMSAYDAAKEG